MDKKAFDENREVLINFPRNFIDVSSRNLTLELAILTKAADGFSWFKIYSKVYDGIDDYSTIKFPEDVLLSMPNKSEENEFRVAVVVKEAENEDNEDVIVVAEFAVDAASNSGFAVGKSNVFYMLKSLRSQSLLEKPFLTSIFIRINYKLAAWHSAGVPAKPSIQVV